MKTIDNTTSTKPTTEQLILDAMRKAGWFTTSDCTIVDKNGNVVKL